MMIAVVVQAPFHIGYIAVAFCTHSDTITHKRIRIQYTYHGIAKKSIEKKLLCVWSGRTT